MNKRLLITGASRGIGRAIAEKLAAPDVTLLLHGPDTVALAETCKAIQVAYAVAFALTRPDNVAVENITLTDTTGNL